MKKILWILFGLYIAGMLWLLFARESLNTGADYWQQVWDNLNLTPLATLRLQYRLLTNGTEWGLRSGVINLYGNVIMFIPLGLGLPWLISGLGKFWKTFLACALAILAVEAAQLLSLRGYGDVDDLILNLIGVALGYGIFWVLHRKAEA